jgi:hypothetical protein
MTFRQSLLLLVTVSMSVALVACGGSSTMSTTPPSPVAVAFSSAAPAALQVDATASLAVMVTNDTANAGVKWSVTCGGGGGCGSFSTSGPGTSTTYTAPSALPSGNNNSVTVTASAVTDSTKSVSATITITASGIGLTFSSSAYPPNALQVGASAPIGVVVTGDPSNNGVTWSATCGNGAAPCGSFTPSKTASGVAATFTAPSVVPAGSSVTVVATSVTNPGDALSIPIFVSLEPTTLANGSYVFQLNGTTLRGFYSVSGVFAVNGGSITGGEQDFIDAAGAKSDTITGGSILAIDDGNLWITLKTGDMSIGVSGVETLDATLLSGSRASLIEFDSSATSSGTLDLQTTTAAPAGGYAFFAFGRDSAKSATVIGGVINVDGPGTISGNGSVFDINDGGLAAPLAAQSFAASTITAPDSMGRVGFKLVPSAASGIAQINLVGYVVDAKHIRLVETTDAYGGFTGGTALGQTGTFTSSSISSANFVFGAAGEDPNGALQTAGLLIAGPNTGTAGAVTGNVTGIFSWNDHTGVANQTPLPLAAGTYTLDTTGVGAGGGRVTLAGLTDSITNPTFNYNLELYLTGDGHGLLILMDQDTVIAGQGFQQTGTGAFTAGSFSGSYALNVRHVVPNGGGEARQNGTGPITADGAGNLAGFVDLNGPGSDLPLSGNFTSSSNGVFTGTLAGLDTSSTPAVHHFAYYLVDASRAVLIETDNAQVTLGFLELQSK